MSGILLAQQHSMEGKASMEQKKFAEPKHSIEQKLQLVQQVRARYHENQYDLSNRERLLYGRTSYAPDGTGKAYAFGNAGQNSYRENYGGGYEDDPYPGESPFSLFRLRFLMALLLLAGMIFMDKNDIKVAGITTETIYEMISADYEDKIEDWVETFSSSEQNT